MKKLLQLIVLLLIFCNVNAQDIIHIKDGNTIEAKVLVVGEKVVKYQKYENQDKSYYYLTKEKIEYIEYENGDIDRLNEVFIDNKKVSRKEELQKHINAEKLNHYEKAVGGCLWSGGAFLFVGTVTNVVSYSVKPKSFEWYFENYKGKESYEKYVENFGKKQRTATIIGWSSIGVSAVLFFASGVIYTKQNKLRNNVQIRAGANMATITYNF